MNAPRLRRLSKPLVAAALACAGLLAAGSASAGTNVWWSIGINAPLAPGVGVGTVVSNGPGVFAAPSVVYAPPAVVYAPAPVVYAPPPVVYAPPRVVYAPPRVVYARPGYGAVVPARAHRHRHGDGHPYRRWDGRGWR